MEMVVNTPARIRKNTITGQPRSPAPILAPTIIATPSKYDNGVSHFFPFSFYRKQTDSSGSTVQIYVTNFNCFMMAYSMTSSCYLEIYMGLGELKMEYTYFEAWED